MRDALYCRLPWGHQKSFHQINRLLETFWKRDFCGKNIKDIRNTFRFIFLQNHLVPLLICFFKYPFGHLFQTEIKIDFKTNWNFFFQFKLDFYCLCSLQNQVRTEMKFSHSQTENFEMEKLSSDTWYFKKPVEINRGYVA